MSRYIACVRYFGALFCGDGAAGSKHAANLENSCMHVSAVFVVALGADRIRGTDAGWHVGHVADGIMWLYRATHGIVSCASRASCGNSHCVWVSCRVCHRGFPWDVVARITDQDTGLFAMSLRRC